MTHLVTLVTSPTPLPKEAIARLAELLATDAYSIRLALNRSRPVILTPSAEADAAEQAVAELVRYGCEAYAIDQEGMKGLAEPLRLRTLEFHSDHLRFVLSQDNLVLSRWDNLFLMVLGRCRLCVQERTRYSPTPGRYTMPGTVPQADSHRESLTEKLDIYFFDGSAPVRIDCDRFSFQFLGSKRGLTDRQSLQTTLQAIQKLAPQAILDTGFEQFRRTGGAEGRSSRIGHIPLGAGGMSTQKDVDDDGPRFDSYSRLSFLIHLKRAERAT